MQLSIRFCGGKRSDFGSHNYEQVLECSLERFQRQLRKVDLYFKDINGPRGGVDKQCRCVLLPLQLPPIVIEDQDECMESLLHRVANRAAYVLSQKLHKLRQRCKQHREQFAADN